jgi:hypothetical protein
MTKSYPSSLPEDGRLLTFSEKFEKELEETDDYYSFEKQVLCYYTEGYGITKPVGKINIALSSVETDLLMLPVLKIVGHKSSWVEVFKLLKALLEGECSIYLDDTIPLGFCFGGEDGMNDACNVYFIPAGWKKYSVLLDQNLSEMRKLEKFYDSMLCGFTSFSKYTSLFMSKGQHLLMHNVFSYYYDTYFDRYGFLLFTHSFHGVIDFSQFRKFVRSVIFMSPISFWDSYINKIIDEGDLMDRDFVKKTFHKTLLPTDIDNILLCLQFPGGRTIAELLVSRYVCDIKYTISQLMMVLVLDPRVIYNPKTKKYSLAESSVENDDNLEIVTSFSDFGEVLINTATRKDESTVVITMGLIEISVTHEDRTMAEQKALTAALPIIEWYGESIRTGSLICKFSKDGEAKKIEAWYGEVKYTATAASDCLALSLCSDEIYTRLTQRSSYLLPSYVEEVILANKKLGDRFDVAQFVELMSEYATPNATVLHCESLSGFSSYPTIEKNLMEFGNRQLSSYLFMIDGFVSNSVTIPTNNHGYRYDTESDYIERNKDQYINRMEIEYDPGDIECGSYRFSASNHFYSKWNKVETVSFFPASREIRFGGARFGEICSTKFNPKPRVREFDKMRKRKQKFDPSTKIKRRRI